MSLREDPQASSLPSILVPMRIAAEKHPFFVGSLLQENTYQASSQQCRCPDQIEVEPRLA